MPISYLVLVEVAKMSTVTVYRFEKYDIKTDDWQRSVRWATEDMIRKIGARTVGDPIDVDPGTLGNEVEGMTDRNFNPHSTGGFQRVVR